MIWRSEQLIIPLCLCLASCSLIFHSIIYLLSSFSNRAAPTHFPSYSVAAPRSLLLLLRYLLLLLRFSFRLLSPSLSFTNPSALEPQPTQHPDREHRRHIHSVQNNISHCITLDIGIAPSLVALTLSLSAFFCPHLLSSSSFLPCCIQPSQPLIRPSLFLLPFSSSFFPCLLPNDPSRDVRGSP